MRIEAGISRQALTLTLSVGQGLPLKKLDQQGQHCLRPHARQGQQVLLILRKRFMALTWLHY